MSSLKLGIIGDGGTNRLWSTPFYYSPGAGYYESRGYPTGKKDNQGNEIKLNNGISSSGPMQDAVTKMVLASKPDHILNLGDMVYNTGASTLYEDNVGRQFNQLMSPYPSPVFVDAKGPYRQAAGNKVWPYDTYNYPKGYPNPVNGKAGGSPDGVNRFWPTIGNHEYYLRTSKQGEPNISLHTDGSDVLDKDIKGQTSTPAPQPFVDYFAWLSNPALAKQAGLSVGLADTTGNSGIYYKVSLGADKTQTGQPLIDIFSIDTMRLIMNRGGKYPQFTDGFGPPKKAQSSITPATATQSLPSPPNLPADWNLEYDPTIEPNDQNGEKTYAVNSTDPKNGWKQFNWLKDQLAQSKARWKIIMGHQPIYGSGGDKGQLDDNVNNPELQRLLKALPKGSFDAYLNGHAHFYQRTLENKPTGIGQGIPFIGLGSSGRILDQANEVKIGQSTYYPTFPTNGTPEPAGSNDKFMAKNNKELTGRYQKQGFKDFLLDSDPISVAISGGRVAEKTIDNKPVVSGWKSLYGFGFGGGTLVATDNSLLFQYKQPEIHDPAIAENLNASSRLKALKGWDKLTPADWRPTAPAKDPITGVINSLDNTAMLRLTFEPSDNGQVSAASVFKPGSGYMGSKRGTHTVDFEIRGNDAITGLATNPNDVAILRLNFLNGSLSQAEIVNNGSGYMNLGQLLQEDRKGFYGTSIFKTPVDVIVPLNYSLVDTWYGAPNSDFKDQYLIAQTKAQTKLINQGSGKALEIKIVGKDAQTQSLLNQNAKPTQWTTGYSGVGQQRGYSSAQQGAITIKNKTGQLIGQGTLSKGVATIPVATLPSDRQLEVLFGGDPTSSYLVNFKPSSTLVTI